MWNANNTYGFEKIHWPTLTRAAAVTAVSKYMKFELAQWGVHALVIPNGIDPALLDGADPEQTKTLREAFGDRPTCVKVGRFDPDKNWLQAIDALADVRASGIDARLIVRGGKEPYGDVVLGRARERGLTVERLAYEGSDWRELATRLAVVDAAVVHVRAFLDEATLYALYAAADVVLANSGKEPFGLVGLEVMAAGGIVVCGATGEEYAEPFVNAIVCDTGDGRELATYLRALFDDANLAEELRTNGARDGRAVHVVARARLARPQDRVRQRDRGRCGAQGELTRWTRRTRTVPVMLVTGGSRGIGAAIVRAAAAAGYEIALTYAEDRAAAERVAAEVNGTGRRAVIVKADVAREEDVLAAYAAVDDAFGRLDALAINAGITGRFTRVDEIDAATLERVLAVNVTGAFLCAREAVRRMSTARGGSGGAIVVVSSRAAGLGSPGEYVHYAASKAAVDTLTRGLAKEVAARGHPRERRRAGIDRHGDPRARRAARTRRAHHADDPDGAHRHGREVAAAVLWLLSDQASYVTGTVVDVSGGR